MHPSSDNTLPRSVHQCEEAARETLPPEVYDYYAGGGEDEVTLRGNRWAFSRWFLRPRRLVDVREVDTSVELLGEGLKLPMLVAPTAFQRLAHPEGELATARGTAASGTTMIISSMATQRVEDVVAASGDGSTWLQLYVFREREITRELIERAVDAGVRAICLTIDVPVDGNRERDVRNRFHLPPGVEMANFRGLVQARFPSSDGSGLEAFIQDQFDLSLDWSIIEWVRSVTDVPLVLKGVLTAEDACLAVELGADAVIVSNHGGRQLDGACPTLLALPEVVEAVGSSLPVLVDGGVRRGTDVLKALALGARAVLVGRPVLWGLALAGQEGVEHVLGVLGSELERALRLLGRTRLSELDASALAPAPEGAPHGPPSTGGSGARESGP